MAAQGDSFLSMVANRSLLVTGNSVGQVKYYSTHLSMFQQPWKHQFL